jgi:hypothetical protein
LRGVPVAAMLPGMQTAIDTRRDSGCPATTTRAQNDRLTRQPGGASDVVQALTSAGGNDELQALAALQKGADDVRIPQVGGASGASMGDRDVRTQGLSSPTKRLDERSPAWASATTSHQEIPTTPRGDGHGRTQGLKSAHTQSPERSRTWATATTSHHEIPTPPRGNDHELAQGLTPPSTALDSFVETSLRREAP